MANQTNSASNPSLLVSFLLASLTAVRFAKSFEDDPGICLVRYHILALRIARWAAASQIPFTSPDRSVNIFQHPVTNIIPDVRLVQHLQKLNRTFEKIRGYNVSSKRGSQESNKTLRIHEISRLNADTRILLAHILNDMRLDQESVLGLDTSSLVIHKARRSRTFLRNIVQKVDNLFTTFPVPVNTLQQKCTAFVTTVEIPTQRNLLKISASGIDDTLSNLLEQQQTVNYPGHDYRKINLKDGASGVFGNKIVTGPNSTWGRPIARSSHTYWDITMEGGDCSAGDVYEE